jgi:hypothetical protein
MVIALKYVKLQLTKGKAWGFITEVVQRRVKQIIGKVAEHEGEYFIQPSNPNQHQPITLEKELIEHANAKVGDMLRVAIDDYPTVKNWRQVMLCNRWQTKPTLKLLFRKPF